MKRKTEYNYELCLSFSTKASNKSSPDFGVLIVSKVTENIKKKLTIELSKVMCKIRVLGERQEKDKFVKNSEFM